MMILCLIYAETTMNYIYLYIKIEAHKHLLYPNFLIVNPHFVRDDNVRKKRKREKNMVQYN